MKQFCDELRDEREQRGVSIESICAVTKVSSRHLLALEAGEYAALPGGVFRKGILRGYLAVLGLDEALWVGRFETSLAESSPLAGSVSDPAGAWEEFAKNVGRTRVVSQPATGVRWLGVAGMFATLSLLIWLAWSYTAHRRLELARPAADRGSMSAPQRAE